jgi:(1->4)-alpha-D-glucan 1-alpha-D-glucosylmutase
VFAAGQYLPLAVDGPAREHVVAFARAAHPHREPAENGGLAEQAAIVVVPRLTARLSSAPFVAPIGDAVWADTVLQLPEPLQNRDWTCVLTRESVSATGGKSFALAQVLRLFPAALLVNHV